MRLTNKEIQTEYGSYEVYLYQEGCKLSCGKCLNDCEFGYQAKELNGETEV